MFRRAVAHTTVALIVLAGEFPPVEPCQNWVSVTRVRQAQQPLLQSGGLLCPRSKYAGLSVDLRDRDNVGDLVITGIDAVVGRRLLYRHS